MQRLFIYLFLCVFMTVKASAQSATAIKRKLNTYFAQYENKAYSCKDKAKVDKFYIRSSKKEVEIVVSEVFLGQPLDNEVVNRIYKEIRHYLPAVYRNWKVIISVNGYPIEKMVPASTLAVPDEMRYWRKTDNRENAWTFPLNRPFEISNGLQNRHLAVWASHGRYYDFRKEHWRWQRPGLFGTCEDILTPTIVTPFLMPMRTV